MQADRVVVVTPNGFCAGVERAVKTLAWMVLLFDRPVYCVHDIVHNQRVIERFRRLGVQFVDDPADIARGAPALLSAHGSTPDAVEAATRRASVAIDAVCPLVVKVHHEIRARARAGHSVLYLGHRGHDEAVGALGVAPEATTLVTSPADVEAAPADGRPVALLAQTTLAVDEWTEILEVTRARFGHVWTAPRDDICFATTNRQEALRLSGAGADAVIVVGSATSANTAALVAVARSAGASVVLRVDGATDLPRDQRAGSVVVTAGASAPPDAVDEVVAALGASVVDHAAPITEEAYFPLPAALRRLLERDPAPIAALAHRDRHMASEDVLSLVEAVVESRRTPVAG